MTMTVRILGPNLPAHLTERHGETFHIHAEHCADINQYGRDERPSPWTFHPVSFDELAYEVYVDQIEEGSMTIDDAKSDLWLAPCVKGL